VREAHSGISQAQVSVSRPTDDHLFANRRDRARIGTSDHGEVNARRWSSVGPWLGGEPRKGDEWRVASRMVGLQTLRPAPWALGERHSVSASEVHDGARWRARAHLEFQVAREDPHPSRMSARARRRGGLVDNS